MASQFDGAGQIKLATLDDAILKSQHVHAIVERFASAVRLQNETGSFRMQLQRAATPLVGLLKPQFGPVADVVVTFLQTVSRGGSEQTKVRALRESIAQVRMQLDIAVTKTKEKHAMSEDAAAPSP